MRHEIEGWVWELDLKPTEKLVLLALASHSGLDKDGKPRPAFPSQGRIAEYCGVRRQCVVGVLKKLEEKGIIRSELRYKDGLRTSKIYHLTMSGNQTKVKSAIRTGGVRNPDSEPTTEPKLETDVSNKTRARALPSFPSKAFDRWWEEYPHKIGKAAAFKSFERIRKAGKVSFQTLHNGLDDYIRDKPPDRPWCNPATWLNQGRWDDKPAPPIPTRRGKVGWGETAKEMIDDITRREEEGDYSDGLVLDEQPAIAATKRH